jgi:hypothetical protein
MSATPGMLETAQARLDAVLNAAPKRSAPTQEHLLLKAQTLVNADKGDFTAVISTERVDREKDVVSADAMVAALGAWTEIGKLVPSVLVSQRRPGGRHRPRSA